MQIAADTLEMKILRRGLSAVEFACLVRLFILSTILEIKLDSEPHILKMFSHYTRKLTAGFRNCMTQAFCLLTHCTAPLNHIQVVLTSEITSKFHANFIDIPTNIPHKIAHLRAFAWYLRLNCC